MATRKTSRSVWENQTTEYNPLAPAVQRALRSEKWKRWALMTAAFGVVPLCLIVSLTTVAANTGPKPADLSNASSQANSSAGKSAAYQAVQSWLASTPAPLPGGSIVSWDGYTVQKPPPADPNKPIEQPPAYEFEEHSFTLERNSQMYTATVQVAVDGSSTATATSTPALTPVIDAPVSGSIVPWFGYQTATASSDVTTAVTAWAAAFTSGDPTTLRRAVQDPNSDHVYIPLTGIDSVTGATVTTAADADKSNKTGKTKQMLVRVQLSIWWAGQKPAEGGTDGASTRAPKPVTYDLLVDGADTASPYVVAWGGPRNWVLTRYG